MTLFFFVPNDNPTASKLHRCGHGTIVEVIRAEYSETHQQLRFSAVPGIGSTISGIDTVYHVTGYTLETHEWQEIGHLFEIP